MQTGTLEREDTYLGNDKTKLKKGENDLYCMHVNGILLDVLHRRKTLMIIMTLKETCDGHTGG